jgi:hypothetical protein
MEGSAAVDKHKLEKIDAALQNYIWLLRQKRKTVSFFLLLVAKMPES